MLKCQKPGHYIMLEINTGILPKGNMWLPTKPAVHHASGECITSKGKEERMETQFKLHRNASKTISLPGPSLPFLSVQPLQVFLPYSCVVERDVSRCTCPVALLGGWHTMPTVLHAHADQMQRAPTSLTVISWV